MIVYILALRRMILDDAIFFVPEQAFEEAHLIPRRRPVSTRSDAHMLPSESFAGYDEEFNARMVDDKGTVVAICIFRGKAMPLFSETKFIWDVEHILFERRGFPVTKLVAGKLDTDAEFL
jgi:hypothetical protein